MAVPAANTEARESQKSPPRCLVLLGATDLTVHIQNHRPAK